MSKTQLGKVLAGMSREEICDLLLSLYDARKEAKDYLDFFVSPDIDRRLEKVKVSIVKEMQRSSRGYNKARSTRLRHMIRDIASLDAGDESVCEIMTFTVETAVTVSHKQVIKESTQRAIAKLLSETLTYADDAGLLNIYLPRIMSAVDSMKSSLSNRNSFKRLLREALEETLEML